MSPKTKPLSLYAIWKTAEQNRRPRPTKESSEEEWILWICGEYVFIGLSVLNGFFGEDPDFKLEKLLRDEPSLADELETIENKQDLLNLITGHFLNSGLSLTIFLAATGFEVFATAQGPNCNSARTRYSRAKRTRKKLTPKKTILTRAETSLLKNLLEKGGRNSIQLFIVEILRSLK